MRKGLSCFLVGAVTAAAGCGYEGIDADGGETANVSIALTTVPAMVACVKVQAVVNGVSQPSALFVVTSGTSSAALNMGPLPIGPATFTGAAYSLACTDPAISTAVPTWISDTGTATLTLGAPKTIVLTFRQNNPVTVSGNFAKSVTSLGAGVTSTYAVMNDGTVRAAGVTGASIGSVVTPTDLTGASSAVEVAVADNFSCLRTTTGEVRCWGILPGGISATTPTLVTLPGPAVQIAAGSSHMCALTRTTALDQAVQCWGSNVQGQLGNGTNTNSTTPVAVAIVASDPDTFAIAAGGQTTCMLTTGARVLCWGNGANGQLGNGTIASVNRPTPASVSGGFTSITVGDKNTCALRADGAVQCWGRLTGDGTSTQRDSPVAVSGLTDATAIASGRSHTCATRKTGQVVCWGESANGQTASAAGAALLAPTLVPGLPATAVDIEAHQGDHSCALLQDGSAWCWGSNTWGQLGDGTITPRFLPTQMKMN